MSADSSTVTQVAETGAAPKTPAAAETSSAEFEGTVTKSVVVELSDRRTRAQIQTVPLDPRGSASTPQPERCSSIASARWSLSDNACVKLAESDARADLIVRLRVLTDALAHMPLET